MLVDAANLGEHGRFGRHGCTTVPVVALGAGGKEVATVRWGPNELREAGVSCWMPSRAAKRRVMPMLDRVPAQAGIVVSITMNVGFREYFS